MVFDDMDDSHFDERDLQLWYLIFGSILCFRRLILRLDGRGHDSLDTKYFQALVGHNLGQCLRCSDPSDLHEIVFDIKMDNLTRAYRNPGTMCIVSHALSISLTGMAD